MQDHEYCFFVFLLHLIAYQKVLRMFKKQFSCYSYRMPILQDGALSDRQETVESAGAPEVLWDAGHVCLMTAAVITEIT